MNTNNKNGKAVKPVFKSALTFFLSKVAVIGTKNGIRIWGFGGIFVKP